MLTTVNAVNPRDDGVVGLSRRERVRAATEAELLGTARALLLEGGPTALTFREVGRRMGMTASALYRYVDSHAALMDRLTASLFDELADELRAAVTEVPDAADASRMRQCLLETSRAFRRWSLAHPAEFRLMFVHSDFWDDDCRLAHEAGNRFGGVFVGLFARGLDGMLSEGDGTLFSPLPPPLGERFARAWIRLLGLVMVEVAEEYDHDYLRLDPDQVFEAEMAECADGILEALRAVRDTAGGH